MDHDLGPQISQGNASSSTKVQGLIQTLLSQSSGLPGFELVHKPDSVHMIS